jgi:hypothetical protein
MEEEKQEEKQEVPTTTLDSYFVKVNVKWMQHRIPYLLLVNNRCICLVGMFLE